MMINALSSHEIINLREVLFSLQYLFEKNELEYLEFKKAPISYLRKQNIIVMKYINTTNRLVQRLHLSIRHYLSRFNILDRCSFCKIMVTLCIYALLGKSLAGLDYINEYLSLIIETIKDFFNTASDRLRSALEDLENWGEKIRTPIIANHICKQLGYCQ